jgi:hypothetical protein
MGRKIMAVLGVLLAVWLLFSVIGWIFAALKFLLFVGVIAFVVTLAVILIGKMSARSS